ncbi:MAG: hypothetical protein HYZ29_08735 [Myxococcales bacterium]|nr:hypothetical protein [Myxococcales bacterium]
MDNPDLTSIGDPVAPAPPPGDRPEPRARFEARIRKDGSVVIPTEMIAPVMSSVLGWWRDQPDTGSQTPPSSADPPGSGPPDGYVDQNDSRIPKRIYLRLARENAFPSSKVGKKILAKWSDVEAALVARRRKPRSRIEPQATDDLDQIRRDMGLVPRGGR